VVAGLQRHLFLNEPAEGVEIRRNTAVHWHDIGMTLARRGTVEGGGGGGFACVDDDDYSLLFET